jgi:predicted dehydrogenase
MNNRKGITRRDFMRSSAGVAGATLGARSMILSTEPLPASPSAAASDRVRFGMIGIGMQGSGLLATAIRLPGVECAAACDLYDGRHELAREIVGKPIPATRRYQELFENKDIDCIIAAVPDHWHKQLIVDACNAGKDIYCEKPMTHHVAEGFEIIAAEQKNNRIVQIGSQRVSSVVYQKAKELYDQGAIGEVWLVEAGLGRNSPSGAWVYPPPPDLSPQNLDWDTWLGTAPKCPFDPIRFARWRGFQDYGEGIPGDLYVHLLTGIHYIAGVTTPPERASSVGGLFYFKDDGRDQPDILSTMYDYPKFRSVMRVTLNSETPEYTRFLGKRGVMEIHGGSITITPQDGEDHGPSWYVSSYPHRLREAYDKEWHEKHDLAPGAGSTVESRSFSAPPGYNDDRAHLWNYFQSVRTRRPSVEDGSFGNNAAIACHMANYSYFKRTVAVYDAGSKEIKG